MLKYFSDVPIVIFVCQNFLRFLFQPLPVFKYSSSTKEDRGSGTVGKKNPLKTKLDGARIVQPGRISTFRFVFITKRHTEFSRADHTKLYFLAFAYIQILYPSI